MQVGIRSLLLCPFGCWIDGMVVFFLVPFGVGWILTVLSGGTWRVRDRKVERERERWIPEMRQGNIPICAQKKNSLSLIEQGTPVQVYQLSLNLFQGQVIASPFLRIVRYFLLDGRKSWGFFLSLLAVSHRIGWWQLIFHHSPRYLRSRRE